MKLSKKFIGIIAFSFLSTAIFVFLFLRLFIINSFNEIELNHAATIMTRVVNYIDNRSKIINALCVDYAQWDETYNFINNRSNEYIESSYNNATAFIKSGADFVMCADNTGDVAFVNYFNSDRMLKDSAVHSLINYSVKLSKSDKFQGVTGLMNVDSIPAFISISPILKSDGSGPINGILVCGDFVDNTITDELYKNENLSTVLLKYNPSALSGSIYNNGKIHISIKDRNNLKAIGIINDIDGNPLQMVETYIHRTIYIETEKSFHLFCLFIAIIGLIASLVFYMFINFIVVKRLEKIKETFDEISVTEDLSIRVNVNDNDEISTLGNNFNSMLERLQKSREGIYKEAYFDSLTGLPNRKKLIEDMDALIKSGNKFSAFYIDIDNFKNINDSLGHDVGDVLLKKVTKRLQSIGDSQINIGRAGGDEFIVICKSCVETEFINAFASKICDALGEPMVFKNYEFFVKVSIGITLYPEGGTSVSELMKTADIAMYAAKEAGGSGYKIYTKYMDEDSLDNLILENSLRKAVDNNELFLEYQPIFNSNNLKVMGAEALCRWKLDNKVIQPINFIPLAKRIGEIVKIDNWVLKQACYQCKQWHNQGLNDLYVSVNISFKQLRQLGFVNYVINILNETELDPKYLSLEITEDEAMEDPDFTVKILRDLQLRNVKISIDDFGSGYSSLNYINKLPLNTIKIDKSLIDNIYDKTNLEIVRSVINLARNLDLNVVSEGIEQNEQLDILRELHCKAIQGYLLSEPLSVEKFHDKFSYDINNIISVTAIRNE